MIFWFKKKVLIELPDGRKIKVPESQIELWEREGLAKIQIKVHMANPNWNSPKIEYWNLKDINPETYEKFHVKGELYASTHYENGHPKITILSKERWDAVNKQTAKISEAIQCDLEETLKEFGYKD